MRQRILNRLRRTNKLYRQTIENSGLFDAGWYLERYPDVAKSKIDPLYHYAVYGGKEGRSPSLYFDGSWYISQYTDVAVSGINPLFHYIKYGAAEGRLPTKWFDSGWYSNQHVDANVTPGNALTHFAKYGVKEGRAVRAPKLPGFENYSSGKEEPFSFIIKEGGPSIVVVIHLYYVDVLPDMVVLLKNIPYKFTALFTVPEHDHIEKAKKIIANFGLHCDAEFKIVKNRGRNFGPSLVEFRNEILKHDVMLHLHTKKSLRTGSEQNNWRQWLFDGLIGSPQLVRSVLSKFEQDDKAGLIYPPAYPDHDYWYHHWLGALHRGRELFQKIGITEYQERGLIDFPVGGMFWAKTDALKKLLNYPWKYDDFDVEPSYHDGTLAHGIERSIVQIVRDANFNFYESDQSRSTFRVNWSEKLLSKYDGFRGHLEWSVSNSDTISFDFYDTVVCRLCSSPDDVHYYIDWVLKKRELISNVESFYKVRKSAEACARSKLLKGDVCLDDIYDHFKFECSWDQPTIKFAKQLELSIEEKVLRLRPDIANFMRWAHSIGKRVIIVSDTYMPLSFFESVTERLGIRYAIDAFYISSETGKRKDRGDVWEWLFKRERREKFVHIGDNEESDTHVPIVNGVSVCPIIHTTVLADLRGLRSDQDWRMNRICDWRNGVIVGPSITKVGGLAFEPYGSFSPKVIDTPFDFGYTVLGSLMFGFLTWTARQAELNGIKKLAFFSREGHFFMKWYRLLCALTGEQSQGFPEAVYYPVSRRVALGAMQFKGIQSEGIIGGANFSGSIGDLLKSRIGYNIDPSSSFAEIEIETSKESDRELINSVLAVLNDDIQFHARGMRERLVAHHEGLGFGASKVGVVDIGYSGTIQRALAQIIPNADLTGFYMATLEGMRRLQEEGGRAFGYFCHDGEPQNSVVKSYSIILEALLTAPHGQVVDYRMQSDGKMLPVFGDKRTSQLEFGNLEQIGYGIERYMRDLISTYGPDIVTADFSPDACEVPFKAFAVEKIIKVNDSILNMLNVEDDFCGNGELAAAKLYNI